MQNECPVWVGCSHSRMSDFGQQRSITCFVSMTASGYRRLLSRMIPGIDCNWGAASGREPLSWWAADQRVSFVGTVLATALRKFNREKANGSFQIYVVA